MQGTAFAWRVAQAVVLLAAVGLLPARAQDGAAPAPAPAQPETCPSLDGAAKEPPSLERLLEIARCQARNQSQNQAPPPPAADQSPAQDAVPPGYHCHYYGLRQRMCHSSFDGL